MCWCPLKSAINNIRNMQKCLCIHGQLQFVDNELIYIYQLPGRFFFFCFCFWRNSPQWARASSFTRFLDHTRRSTTIGRTLLDEWSARRRDLCVTTHTTLITNVHAPGGIRTHNLSRRSAADLRLDRAATGTGRTNGIRYEICIATVAISARTTENWHLTCVFGAKWSEVYFQKCLGGS